MVEKWVKATVSDPVGHRTAEWPEQSWWQVRVSSQEAYLAQAPGLLRAPSRVRVKRMPREPGCWPAAHLPWLTVPLAQRGR